MLLGLVMLVLAATAFAVAIRGSGIGDRFGEILAAIRAISVSDESQDSEIESSVTKGLPPDLSLPPGGTAARSKNRAYWITSEDYPGKALRNDWQGAVRIVWIVDSAGWVGDCYVVESSGHDVLDEAACRMIKRRARYDPARDARGEAIRSSDRRRVVWRLPE